MSTPSKDAAAMRRAIALSRKGFPTPNPHVGCVITGQDGSAVGEGWCDYAGAPHAEAMALGEAGTRAAGGTAYVTLEPCNHFGRTPPCSQALIRAGVRRVVIAALDPNPVAAGGAKALREAGIEVEVGLLAESAAEVNHQFLFAMANARPEFTLKAAVGLDGRIALPNGESKWITGPTARKAGHALRAECGAVLVGCRTVSADNPELTARVPGVTNPPVRIVLDPNRRLTGKERVFDRQAETWHITGPIDLPALAADWYRRGITGVLVEGGAITHGHFLQAGLADRIELFVAPKVLGAGPSWVHADELPNPLGLGWEIIKSSRRGEDIQVSLRKRFA